MTLRSLSCALIIVLLTCINVLAQRALPVLPEGADINVRVHEPFPSAVNDIASVGQDVWAVVRSNYLDDASSTLWKWDGVEYSTVDCPYTVNTGSYNSVGLKIVKHEGDVYICGRFAESGDVLKYDGTSWEDLGANSNLRIYDLAFHNGSLYVVGDYSEFNDQSGNHVYRYQNGIWEAVGSPSNGELRCIQSFNGSLYVGGDFSEMGNAGNNIARLGDSDWEAVGVGLDGMVTDMAIYSTDLYLVGNFVSTSDASTMLHRVCRLENEAFLPVTDDSYMIPPGPTIDHTGDQLYICSTLLPHQGSAIVDANGIEHFDAFPMVRVTLHEGALFFAGGDEGIEMFPYQTMLYRHDPHRVTNDVIDNGTFCVFSSFGPTQVEDPFGDQPACEEELTAQEFSTIRSASLWYAGVADEQVFGAGSAYFPGNENDVLRVSYGPISESYDLDYLHRYYAIWKVTKEDVEYHIEHFQDAGYQPKGNIMTYPGNGRVEYDESPYLLPFIDVDEDGWYEPMDGDHPLIRGDQSIFTIHSDDRYGNQEEKAGIELITEMYSFDDPDDDLAHTIFVHTEMRNRSDRDYTDFSTGVWTDFTIEISVTDYVGSAPEGNYFYAFNGIWEEGGFPQETEDENPAQAVVLLSEDLHAALYFNNSSSEVNGYPLTPSDHHAYLNGRWKNGQPMYFGGNGIDEGVNTDLETRFMFPDFPWETGADHWNEVTAGNPPSERRMVGSVTPFDFNSGTTYCIDYAYVTAYPENEEPYNEVVQLDQRVAGIKLWFAEQDFDCSWPQFPLEVVSEVDPEHLLIYPNPTNGLFSFANAEGLTSMVTVRDISGSEICRFQLTNGSASYDLSDLAAGVYLVEIEALNRVERLVVR